MPARLNAFEEFILLFENVKSAAHGSPERLVGFFDESEAVRRAVEALESFLMRTNLELDDALRAYVFGAPAAAFAMCRAAFEMILKRHYGEGEWETPKEKLLNRTSADALKSPSPAMREREGPAPQAWEGEGLF